MKIRTLQWNIGGGKIRRESDDPTDPLVYCNDAIESFIEVLKKYKPDIVTLQESHTDDAGSQAEKIAMALGCKHFVNNVYDESHLEKGQGLSQTIISRFQIENPKFELFFNPKYETISETGEHWISHDKGITSCLVELKDGKKIQIKTSHSVPYRSFNVDPFSDETLLLRTDMAQKIKPSERFFLYQGDLNVDVESLRTVFPNLIVDEVEEVIAHESTTPKGRRYDHIIYKGIKYISSEVISDVLSDHYPIISEFEL